MVNQDRVVLITGGTSGIGRAAATALARQGGTIIVVGRDEGRCRAARDAIRQESGNHQVEAIAADLAEGVDVVRLAGEVLSRWDRLDVLINNVGRMIARRERTSDSLEMTFALNHLAPFALTRLLLDRLRTSAPARVVTVSSFMHVMGRIRFDDLQSERWYHGREAYTQSKLANVLFTFELARRLADCGVIANAVDPGLVVSNLGRRGGGIISLARPLLDLIALSPSAGADGIVWLAGDPEVAGVSGGYFAGRRQIRAARAAYDLAQARRLWEISVTLGAPRVGLANHW